MYTFERISFPEDTACWVDFLLSENWPFHAGHPHQSDKEKLMLAHAHNTPEEEYFWIVSPAHEKVGYFKLFDLDDIGDGHPLFDLRIASAHRGKGIGEIAVNWLSDYLFESWPELKYIQGTTRDDNIAMRKVFLRCRYVKEGHIRKGWDDHHDTILYGLLREDWESGMITPVNWDDEQDLKLPKPPSA